jgi:hypothetical protein
MIIYTNGCSHTAGHCFKRAKSWPNIVMKSIIGNHPYSNNSSYDSIKENSNVLYNQALHGAGNDYIFHTSLETISGLLSSNNKPDYVIIQWSGPNRRLHSTPEGGHLFVNPYDNTELGVIFEPMASKQTLNYIFTMQEFLKHNNINYLFFNYMGLSKLIKKTKVYTHIDFNNIVDFGLDESMFSGLIDFFKSKNMNCDEGGHPNEDGNYFIGKHITEKLGHTCIDYSEFYNTLYI